MRVALRDPEVMHRRRWITLVVLCVSVLVIVLDNTIVNVALPTLARAKSDGGIGASVSSLQWVVDAYTLVFAGLLLTAGSLGDRFGRYNALAFGEAVFVVFSAVAAVSNDPAMLIAARALMGAGAAFMMPATLSILTNVFTDPRERGRAIGVWAGVAGVGGGVGPLAGGFLLRHFWWGSVFLVNVPIVAAGLIAGYFFIPNSKDPASPRLDPFGALLSVLGIGTLLWSVIEGPTRGWTSTAIVAGFVAGGVLVGVFLVWERVCTHPMLNTQFFANPRFSVASGAITLTFLALLGTLFLMTQYLQSVRGYSPLQAGAILLPQSVVMLVLAPNSARLVERFGTKLVTGLGLCTVTLALVLMGRYSLSTNLVQVMGVNFVLGVGMSHVMAPATEAIMGSLPRAKAGVGSAVNDTTRQLGAAIGVALMGSLLSSRYISHLHHALAGTGAPRDAIGAAQTNIQAAVEFGRHTTSPVGVQVVTAAKHAFLSGFHLAAVVAAVIEITAATGVFLWLPARARLEEEAPAVVTDTAAVATANAV